MPSIPNSDLGIIVIYPDGTGILIDLSLIEINHGTGLIFTSSIDNMRKKMSSFICKVVQLHNYDEIWVLVKVSIWEVNGEQYTLFETNIAPENGWLED